MINTIFTLWPLGVYFVLVVIVAAGMIGGSYFLGERHREKATDEPYESGITTTGTARVRLSAKFYLEAAFIFAWAVAFRQLGWPGYAEVVVFIGILLATLVYLWRDGALDWGTNRRQPSHFRKEPVE